MSSFYDLLGVPPSASADDITAAYRARALELHPDVAGAESADAFRALSEAYQVLKDPASRARYDALQAGGGGGGGFTGFAAGGGPRSSTSTAADPFDEHFARWWEAQGFNVKPDARSRERARAAAAAAAAEEWEREKAGARAARAAFAARRARTVEARAVRHAAVLRGFWQAKPGLGWADGVAAVLAVASLGGVAWLARAQFSSGRRREE